jgi:thiamine biosynthesis lipoprotein
MTVDRAVGLLKKAGFKDFMVSAGGDMYLSGNDHDRQFGWQVNVENPFTFSDNLTRLQVKNCGVATSSITKRRWLKDDKLQHHLIDPRTAQPVETKLACVTVIAPNVRLADGLAKTALILGPDLGRQFLEQQPGCSGLFIGLDGSLLRTANLREDN